MPIAAVRNLRKTINNVPCAITNFPDSNFEYTESLLLPYRMYQVQLLMTTFPLLS